MPINTPDTKVSMELFPLKQLRCLSLMGRLKISTFSTNSLKMLKMKSNKGWRTGESRNYRAIFQRAKQNTRSPPAPAAEIHGEFGAGLGLSALCRHSAEPRGLQRVEPYPVLLQPVPELPCLNDESKPSSRDRRCCSLPRGHCWGVFFWDNPPHTSSWDKEPSCKRCKPKFLCTEYPLAPGKPQVFGVSDGSKISVGVTAVCTLSWVR